MRKTYTLIANLTPGRREWLEKLAAEGTANRPRGPVGFQCMRLGWTQWVWSGEGDDRKVIGEELTEEGRHVLDAAISAAKGQA